MQRPLKRREDLDALHFSRSDGLVTVVSQDTLSGRVLMVAHADREALERTLETGEMWYRSRARGLWHKGATSGNTQKVEELFADCDGDAVLALVLAAGPACHTNAVTCFGDAPSHELARLDAVIAQRSVAPTGYTGRLLSDRNIRLKKLGEETAELAVACADGDARRAVAECADLVYHALVALRACGAGLSDVVAELANRRSGARALL
jgi:phosphoribosyl-ATP pyrophosphohydrolase/phosphoribosyl-AMP cyclohydrolase